MRDKVSLIKEDGSRFDNIKANVQRDKIFIDDVSLPIEEGDKLKRTLPNKLVESYIVLERGYYESIREIPSHYQVKVRKESAIPASTPSSIVYNLIGDGSRVNINSQDSSVNVKNIISGDLFEELKKAIEKNVDNDDKKSELLSQVDEMEDAQGTNRSWECYNKFIATAANYMTLLAPFLPCLVQLLS
jgi:hypothetical protein